MKKFVEIINYCIAQKGSGEGSKDRIQDAVSKLTDDGKKLVAEAMSPYRRFNVKKFDEPDTFAEVDADVNLFLLMLNDLHDRNVTGNAARDGVTQIMSHYTEETYHVLRKVILQNLNAGFSAETVNKLFTGSKFPPESQWIIPWYNCMLGDKMPKKDAPPKKQIDFSRGWIMEAKYDGQRNQAFQDATNLLNEDGSHKMVDGIHMTAPRELLNNYSEWKPGQTLIHRARSGLQSDQYNGLFDDELKRLQDYLGYPFVLDGEMMGDDFQSTMNAKGSDNQEARDNITLWAYDLMPMYHWADQTKLQKQKERSKILEEALVAIGATKIKKSLSRFVTSREEADEFYEYLIENGYEGAMLKDPEATYDWEKRKAWIKWKPVETYDAVITGVYEGKADSFLAGTLGGVYVKGITEDGIEFTARCGSGFKFVAQKGYKEPLRGEIWENPEDYIGRTIEMEGAPDLSYGRDSEIPSVRWPIFIKFRPDKDR